MKRILLSAAAAMFLLISCNDKGGGDSQAAKNKENYKKVLKAIETGDTAVLSEYIAKDAVDHGAGPNGSDLKGDSTIAALSHAKNGFTDMKFELLADAAEGDYVFGMVRLVGTASATPIWGFQPNQKVNTITVDVVKCKDGKAVDHWAFMDPKDAMAMMQGMQQPKMEDKMMIDTTKK